MKVIIQRVTKASVTVGEELISSIGKGLCVLVGISRKDTPKDAEYLIRKILNLRIFDNDEGKRWDKSVMDKQYEILCVSQFTLDVIMKGNKPDFHEAMGPDLSQQFYNTFLQQMRLAYSEEKIKDGKFGAMMQVHIQNDGPVTIPLESPANLPGLKSTPQPALVRETPALVTFLETSIVPDTSVIPETSIVPYIPILPYIPISSKVVKKPRVDKLENEKGVVKKHQRERSLSPEKLLLYIHARAVRVGTFCSTPIEPIKFSDERIHFHLREMCHQWITVLLDSVDNNIIHKFGNVMEIYKKYGQSQDDDFYLELNDEETDELLKQSTHLMCGRNTADN